MYGQQRRTVPTPDVNKFHDELLWQEFARHWYARLGHRTARGVRRVRSPKQSVGAAWDRSMACIDVSIDELESDGWLVNQARMWLASQWAVRSGSSWSEGEDVFFRHLLDGSRAAQSPWLAMDERRRFLEALRLQQMAGQQTGARAL